MQAYAISVILCAYTEKRWDDMLSAVASVQNQTVTPQEIILVIDHNPQLQERAHKHLQGVRIIENSEARGLSGARNSGIAVARGDILAFMDEDAVAAPNWLEHLITAYEDSNVLGSGGAINPLWVDSRPAWFPDEFDWVVGCTYRGMPEGISPVRNLIGCNMSYRREVFESVGGFRNGIGRIGTLPVGCEETELCIRATQNQPTGKFLYIPQARVNHRVPGTRANFAYFRSRCYAEGISKALIAQFVGSKAGLNSEWKYTLETLPRGFFKGIGDTLLRRDLSGLGRAVAIASGLGFTTFGYLQRKLTEWIKKFRTRGQTQEILLEGSAN